MQGRKGVWPIAVGLGLDALTDLPRPLGILLYYMLTHVRAFNVFSLFAAMNCTFHADTVIVALVSQYNVQRLTQEAEMVFIYSLATNVMSFIHMNTIFCCLVHRISKIRVTQQTPTPFTYPLTEDLLCCQQGLSTSCCQKSPCRTIIINEPAVVLPRQEVVVNAKILSTAHTTAARVWPVLEKYHIRGEIFR